MNVHPSVMKHVFSLVPEAEIQRSSFDRSHCHKTTFDSGYLVPVFIDEALPGDTFNLSMSAFARLATPLKPVMDNLYLDSFFFAVPYRLVWSHWEKFNGAQDNPGDSVSFNIPQCTGPSGNGILTGTLHDYMGLPVGKASVVFNNLFPRAYNLIWNTWFRDENLQNSVTVDTGDGPDTYANYVLLRRGKRHDYFTSCLPWPQKNNGASVTIPLGTTAPVIDAPYPPGVAALAFSTDLTSGLGPSTAVGINADNSLQRQSDATKLRIKANGQWLADLTNATAATINSLRQAFQLQKLYERDARGGTRYTEILRSHFGVVSPDARLQRPEYLGGGSTPVNISPVAQTAPSGLSGANTNFGDLSGFGTVVSHGNGFSKSFTEHCLVIGLVSVRADLTYQQGLDRHWSRRTRFDYYWPALAHIGEQAILNQEIYCNMDGNDASVFGYQERFAEYRYKPSKISGLFRSNVGAGSTSIDLWHLSQNFGALPVLGDTFIKETPPISRVVAVNTANSQFLFDSFFKFICARPMPVYGVPGLIDRF